MIDKIIDLSVKHRFIISLAMVLGVFASYWAVKNTPLDALPDLTPPQVIVKINWKGQAPTILEDQVTYPLISAFMAIPNIETVRGMSSFENGLIYIIFKEDVDLYWGRSRVLEQLSSVSVPAGAEVTLGPDSSGVGWAYEYALKSDRYNLAELRSLQDYYYKYALLGVDGVSEVASIGGFVKNYQVVISSHKLAQYNLSLKEVTQAIGKNNADEGGRIIINNGYEWIVQANGYLEDVSALENTVIRSIDGISLLIKDIACVEIVPENRRGISELNGEGEVVGGIVMVRYNADTYTVIQEVKKRLSTLDVDGVEVVPTYDRSELIEKAVTNLEYTLLEESIIVLVVVLLFLLHFRSALVVVIVLPLTIGFTFLLMKLFGIGSNIMSLGGIAISIGAMIDAMIVMLENAHKALQKLPEDASEQMRQEAILRATKQVGKPIFFALLLVVVSFVPIFALSGQEGTLFSPLAYTKTFAMSVGAILSITLVPILMIFLLKGKIRAEEKNPLNQFFIKLLSPLLYLSLRFRYVVVVILVLGIVMLYPLYKNLNWEFMPPLNEQTFMYMPVTPYGLSIDLAKELTQKTDKILKSFPEVETVFGKAGRANSATDPAPLAMIETIITFKPQDQWREGMTYKKLLDEMEETLHIKGLTNSWTYPIRGRIDMLLSGIRTPLGIKLYGDNLKELEKYSKQIETKLASLSQTQSVFADRSNAGYYMQIDFKDEGLEKYGMDKQTLLAYVSSAIGGKKIGTFYDRLERYPISIRFEEEERLSRDGILSMLVKTQKGMIPLDAFVEIHYKENPSVVKSEKGRKVSFVYITPYSHISSDSYKQVAKKALEALDLPSGYYVEWAGQSEYLDSAMERLTYIFPVVLIVIMLLIYVALGNLINALIVFFSLPFAILGGLYYIDILNYNISVAVIVGFLALLGIAAETAIVMILYLEEAISERVEKGIRLSKEVIKEAIYEGAILRVRPKLMTVFAILAGLMPIMYSDSVGSEVMQRIAAPMIGGMVSSAVLSLLLIPAVYYMVVLRREK